MSDITEGKIEYKQVASNSIDLISRNDGSIIAQVMTDEYVDELGAREIEIASNIQERWNTHDTLTKQREDLLAALEKWNDSKY